MIKTKVLLVKRRKEKVVEMDLPDLSLATLINRVKRDYPGWRFEESW